MWGSTVNLRGTKGESNTFSSCEFQLFVQKLCQGVTVTHLNSPQELASHYDKGVNCQFKEFQELLIFNSVVVDVEQSMIYDFQTHLAPCFKKTVTSNKECAFVMLEYLNTLMTILTKCG